MRFGSLVKGLTLAGAVAFASSAMADGFARGSVKDRVVAAPFSWTGLYVGANLGAVWLKDDAWTGTTADAATAASYAGCLAANSCPLNRPGHTQTGAIGGLQAGYNFQFSNVVAGLEFDFQGTTANASRSVETVVAPFQRYSGVANTSLESLGTVRARLGLLLSPTLLAYVTGGFAYGEVTRTYGDSYITLAQNAAGRSSGWATGWTAGAGLEWAIANRVTFGAEYLWVNLDASETFRSSFVAPAVAGCNAANCNVNVRAGDIENHIARVKVNFKL